MEPEVNDFEADDDTGTPRLITDNAEPTASSIRNFIGDIPEFQLKSDESRKLNINLEIPKDQPAGAYYGVIRFKAFPISDVETEGGQEIALTASVGHIVLLEVPGEIDLRLIAQSLKAERGGRAGTFFANPPDGMALSLRNVGNGFIKPFGTVTIENFSGEEVFSYEINNTDPRGNILPDSSRTFHDKIENIGSGPGRYKAVASVAYSNGGDVLVVESTFWVIPWWLRILIAVVLLILGGAIIYTVRKIKEHRQGYKRR